MTAPASPSPGPSADLRLRANPRPALRLSRKVLIGLSCVAGIAVGGAVMIALQPQTSKAAKATASAPSIQNKPVADQFTALPKDYTQVPRLGPPLPGDLGKVMLGTQSTGTGTPAADSTASMLPAAATQTSLPAPPVPSAQTSTADRSHQLRQSAIDSQIFATSRTGSEPVATAVTAQTPADGLASLMGLPATATPEAKSTQDRQVAFINQAADRVTTSPDRLQSPVSPYTLLAGSVVPAALITGLRSDLPGQVTAQVTENVYDSVTGRFLLIPQGSRLIGQYDNAVAFGQNRVLLAWTRLILPDGRSLVLEKLSAADAQGLAGLADKVDYHWSGMLQAAALSTFLSIGSEAGSSDRDSDIVRALRSGAADSISRTGQQVVERQLNIQPSLTIRPGFPVRVILTRDLVLAPIGG